MTGFLQRLASRVARGNGNTIRPRVASRFEPRRMADESHSEAQSSVADPAPRFSRAQINSESALRATSAAQTAHPERTRFESHSLSRAPLPPPGLDSSPDPPPNNLETVAAILPAVSQHGEQPNSSALPSAGVPSDASALSRPPGVPVAPKIEIATPAPANATSIEAPSGRQTEPPVRTPLPTPFNAVTSRDFPVNQPAKAVRSHEAPRSQGAPNVTPTIEVTIGRLEVRAGPATAPKAVPRAQARAPRITLEKYGQLRETDRNR
jgi:hypothetical protein